MKMYESIIDIIYIIILDPLWGRGKLIISFRPINLKNNLTTFLVLRLQAKIDHLLLQNLTFGILVLEKLSVSGVEKSEHHSV